MPTSGVFQTCLPCGQTCLPKNSIRVCQNRTSGKKKSAMLADASAKHTSRVCQKSDVCQTCLPCWQTRPYALAHGEGRVPSRNGAAGGHAPELTDTGAQNGADTTDKTRRRRTQTHTHTHTHRNNTHHPGATLGYSRWSKTLIRFLQLARTWRKALPKGTCDGQRHLHAFPSWGAPWADNFLHPLGQSGW